MRAKNEDTAPAQGRRALLHHQVAFFFVQGIRQRVRAERRVFRDRRRQVGAIGRYAAGKEELPNRGGSIPVRFANRFHHARCAGHIDAPHLVDIENP